MDFRKVYGRMENDVAVYVSALQKSLQDKREVIQRLYDLTKNQAELLRQEKMDVDVFDGLMLQKDELIQKMQRLDKSFDSLFGKVGDVLKANPATYRVQIEEMQGYIRQITDYSVKIQAMELRNKEAFALFLAKERKEIRSFNTSSRMAGAYHQNMANQHQEWQTYFLDKKK